MYRRSSKNNKQEKQKRSTEYSEYEQDKLDSDNSERFFQYVLENSSDFVGIVNPDGTLRYESPSMEGLLGYTSDEVIGKNTFEYIHPDSVPQAAEAFDTLLKNPELPVQMEVQVQHKNGSWHTIEITGKNFIDDPIINGIIVNFHDVTDRKEAVDAVRHSEEKLRQYLEFSPDAVYINDANGVFLYGNKAAEELIGYSREELIGKSFLELNLLPPEYFELGAKGLEKNIAGKPTGPVEYQLIRKDGSLIPVEISAYPIGQGETMEAIGIARDITGRKQAEIELRESEERYRLVTDNVTDVIWTLDMNLQFTYISPSVTRQRGFTVEEAISLGIEKTATPESAELATELIFKELLKIKSGDYSDSRVSHTMELELYCKDGSTIWTETTANFMHGSDGKPIGILGVSRDITERRDAEEAIREAEKRYKAIFDNNLELVFINDEQGRFLDTNDATLQRLGYNRDDLESLRFQHVCHPEDLNKAFATVAEVLTKGYMEKPIELRVISKTKEVIWVETFVIPLEHDGEHYIGMGLAHDITDRKKANQALLESEQKFRKIFEVSPEAIVLLDHRGCIVDLNPRIFDWLGYEPEDVMGKNLLELPYLPEASKAKAVENFMRRMSGEEIGPYELIFNSIDGEERIGLVTASSIQGIDETESFDLILIANITDLKKAEEGLQQRTQQILALQEVTASMQSTLDLKEILQRISEAVVSNIGFDHSLVFIRDEDKNVHRGITFYTKGDQGLVGDVEGVISQALTAVEIPVQRGYSKVVDDSLDCIISIVHNLYEIGEPPLTRDECNTVQSLLNAKTILNVPFYVKNQLVGSVLVFTSHDEVSDAELDGLRLIADHAGIAIENATLFLQTESRAQALKESQKEIRELNKDLEQRVAKRTRQLEAINKELESFAYSVSHDLRAPLRHIDGFTHMLLEDCSDSLDDQGKDYLQRINSNVARMTQLIDGILDLSRMTRAELDHTLVNLSAIAKSIAEELNQQQNDRNVQFDITPGLIVDGDARLLHAVLDNLIRNAWKFTSKHDTAKIEFGSIDNNGVPVFYVRDDGAGFDMANANNLFGTFQRMHTEDEFEGSGIGLATVKRIINRHGGEVWAESEVEKGATFYFTL